MAGTPRTTRNMGLPPLWTPEELEAHYEGRITEHAIRALVTAGRVVCTRGQRRQILFTAEQVPDLLRAMADEPEPAATTTAADAA